MLVVPFLCSRACFVSAVERPHRAGEQRLKRSRQLQHIAQLREDGCARLG